MADSIAPVKQNLLALGEALHPRRHVHRLAEVVDRFVQGDRDGRAAVKADLQHQRVGAVFAVEGVDRLQHLRGGGERARRVVEHRHHRVADRLHHRAFVGLHHLGEPLEVLAYQAERAEVADLLVERGRALEVGEQHRHLANADAFGGVNHLRAEQPAKRLAGEHPAAGEEPIELHRWQPGVLTRHRAQQQQARLRGLVAQGEARRPRPQRVNVEAVAAVLEGDADLLWGFGARTRHRDHEVGVGHRVGAAEHAIDQLQLAANRRAGLERLADPGGGGEHVAQQPAAVEARLGAEAIREQLLPRGQPVLLVPLQPPHLG
ncbi:MAG: hypothetical protein QM723_31390 [Myxococcaceae bacterium]